MSEESKQTTVQKNQAEEFCEKYSDQFEKLLDIPLVAMCMENHDMIPYEYSTRQLRYRRIDSDINHSLATELRGLAVYCIKNKIPKSSLKTIAGGNLWSYDSMKKSFSN